MYWQTDYWKNLQHAHRYTDNRNHYIQYVAITYSSISTLVTLHTLIQYDAITYSSISTLVTIRQVLQERLPCHLSHTMHILHMSNDRMNPF